MFLDKILKYPVGILVAIWLARYLGPEDYGILSFAIAFTALFGSIANLGLNKIVVRELVNFPEKKNDILGSTFIMLIVAGAITSCIATLSIYLLNPEDQLTIWLVFIISLSFIFFSFRTISYYFESRVESKKVVLATNIAFILSCLIKIFLIVTGQGLIKFAIVIAIESVLIAFGLYLVSKYSLLNISKWTWNSKLAYRLIQDSFPLILSGIMIIIFMKIDQIMIRQIVSDHEAGLYSAAVQLSEIWYFVPIIIKVSVFPNINKSENDQVLYSKMSSLFKLMVIYSFTIIIPTTIFSKTIVRILYGSAYIETAPMLAISIWALLFTSLGVAKGAFIIAKNYVKLSFYFTSIAAITNIVLNYTLIPKFGGIGAAIATIISVAISAYFSSFLFKPLYKIGIIMTKSLFLLPTQVK